VACGAISSAPIIVPAAIATSAHQNARPIEMTTAPRTTLNTFTLPPSEREVVPRFAVPRPVRDLVNVMRLDIPA
jgi:hypothetical protein